MIKRAIFCIVCIVTLSAIVMLSGCNDDSGNGTITSPSSSIFSNPPSCAVVTNEADSGEGSLRAMIAQVSSSAECDTVTFSSDISHITVKTPLQISGRINIIGNDSGVLVSGGNRTGVFQVNLWAEVGFQNLTIADGTAELGGGIYMKGGTGGGSDGTVIIGNGVKIINNRASRAGGGIYSFGEWEITLYGIVEKNFSEYGGGGIKHDAGTLTVYGKILNNTVNDQGGGIANGSASNSTAILKAGSSVSGNTAKDGGESSTRQQSLLRMGQRLVIMWPQEMEEVFQITGQLP